MNFWFSVYFNKLADNNRPWRNCSNALCATFLGAAFMAEIYVTARIIYLVIALFIAITILSADRFWFDNLTNRILQSEKDEKMKNLQNPIYQFVKGDVTEALIIFVVVLGAVIGHLLTFKIQLIIALFAFGSYFLNKPGRTAETPIMILGTIFLGSVLLGNVL